MSLEYHWCMNWFIENENNLKIDILLWYIDYYGNPVMILFVYMIFDIILNFKKVVKREKKIILNIERVLQ